MLDAFAVVIFSVLVGFQPHHLDANETPFERAQRMAVAALAVSSVSAEATCQGDWAHADWCKPIWPGSRRELAALLVMKARMESGLARRIQEGDCRGMECDAYRDARGTLHYRAHGYWQLQESAMVPRREWRAAIGLDAESVRTGAWAAAKVLSASRKRCARWSPEVPWDVATVSGYASGNTCVWSGAPPRVAVYRSIFARMR